MSTAPVLVVTGTLREAAPLPRQGLEIIAGGGDAAGLAARLAERARHAAGIVSFGMGGALDPALHLGDWVIADRIAGARDRACDPRWAKALALRLPQARVGALHADGELVADVAAKARLAATSQALAVDMESHIAAHAAEAAGVPFVALRCMSDEADDALPPAVAVAMRPGGGLALGAVLASLLRQPAQIPGLIGTGLRFNRAYRLFRADACAIGARLGFDG